MIENDENNLYFCNYDCYDKSSEWLSKFTKIFTNDIKEFEDFNSCMKYLISNNYFVSMNIDDNLIKLINEKFNLNIEDTDNLNIDQVEEYICESLKSTNKGLVNIYSAGDFYRYSVVSTDTIKKLKELFKPLFENYMK